MEELESQKYPVTFKRSGWSTPAAIVVVMIVMTAWYLHPTMFLAVTIVLAALYVLVLQLKFSFFHNNELKIDKDRWLVQQDSSGNEIARVDLNTPFTVEYLFKGQNCAIYQLTQDKLRLRFSAETKGSEHVIKNILRLQWPPYAFWWPLS